MDWTRPFRVDSFEYKWVNPANLDDELGELEGVTGGSVLLGYETDDQISGSLDVTCDSPDGLSGLLRVYALCSLGDETAKVELCTCYTEAGDMERLHGRWKGSLLLRGPLSRYKDDCIAGVWTAAKGTTWKSQWKRTFAAVGGAHLWRSDLPDRSVSASKTLDFGSTHLDWLEAVRKAVGGRLACDSHGRVVMERYVAPAKKECSKAFPTGPGSVTLAGVARTNPHGDMPNRVVVRWKRQVEETRYVLDSKGRRVRYTSGPNKGRYKTKKTKVTKVSYGRAKAAASSLSSKESTGRWRTEAYDVENPPKYGGKVDLDKTAASKLATLASAKAVYTVEHFYMPIWPGEVWELDHDGVHVQAMVDSVEIRLEPGLRCKTDLRHVRHVK